MENNFLKLNSSVDKVEDELKDGSRDTVYMRGSGVQLPYSNKVSVLPQFRPYMPFVATVDVSDVNRRTFNAHRAAEASKPTGSSPQLTIFYNGSISVYDNVSPEKARDIMHLAQNMTNMTLTNHPPCSRPPGGENSHGHQSVTAQPCFGLSTPVPVTSQANVQSGSVPNGLDETMVVKPRITMTAHSTQSELTSTSPPMRPAVPRMLSFPAVPQARHASLRRFLEKRKERIVNTTPYSATPESSRTSLSGSTGSSSAPASKEQSWFPQHMIGELNTKLTLQFFSIAN